MIDELSDNKIIKALERCVGVAVGERECIGCPLFMQKNCFRVKDILALDLINRQKAEIDGLHEEVDKQYETAEANVRAEIASGGTSCHWCEDKVRAKAIKEFAERLKSVVAIHNGDMWSKYEYIDNLVKEMVGE